MQEIILSTFTYEGKGGNKAGLVIVDKPLNIIEMQTTATRLNLSETAFARKIDEKNYEVRFFTPTCEVDLCGHATIAAFYYIGDNYIKDKTGIYTLYQHTKAGKLEVEIEFCNGKVKNVMMTQASPIIYGEIDDIISISRSLGIVNNEICLDDNISFLQNKRLMPTIVSTGLKDLIIPVKNRKILNSIIPNYELIKRISKENDLCGYHVFAFDGNQIYARNFAPLVGINEECATGTSNGALGALLYSKGLLSEYFEVLQGETMNNLSKICVYVDKNVVKVGGDVNTTC